MGGYLTNHSTINFTRVNLLLKHLARVESKLHQHEHEIQEGYRKADKKKAPEP